MRTLVTLAISLVFLYFSPGGALGQDIQAPEILKVDRTANLKVAPKSFCVTEDNIFLIPDEQAGMIKAFGKDGNYLKFITALGSNGFDNVEFVRPRYCLYSKAEGKLGIIDYMYEGGSLFILSREGKIGFKPIRIVECRRSGYDMGFSEDGEHLIISGNLADKENNPFGLYSVKIETGAITYLLQSYEKYGLKNVEEYILEYRKKQTLPAIGNKAFFDIYGNDLYLVWEGALRIIKFDLPYKKVKKDFGKETPFYTKPDGIKLSESYKKGDFKTTWSQRENYSYVRNIFATSRYVFVIYETGKKDKNYVSTFRLQTYTPEGIFLGDAAIKASDKNKPGRQMWLDKENYELYAFSELSGSGGGEASILKYKINVK